MTETIIVALITLASGVLGASIGAITSVKASNKESERYFRDEKKACYALLLSSYSNLMGEISTEPNLIDGLPPEQERKLYTQFQIAHTNALLICDKSSISPISEFFNQVAVCHLRKGNPSELHSAYVSALAAMRKELEASEKQLKNRGNAESIEK